MNIMGYGFMMYLAIGYEILKVIFYVLGTLCFIKYRTCNRAISPAQKCCGTMSLPSRPPNNPTAFR